MNYRRLLASTTAFPPEEKTDPIGYNILVQSILDIARSLVSEGKSFPRNSVGKNLDIPPW